MTYSSSLIDERKPFALDTSVLINLHACTLGDQILAAIPNDIVVPRIVAEELENETSRENGEQNFLFDLITNHKVTVVDLAGKELELFEDLTSGSPSLDDGEAATIAIAVRRELLPVIDEKKGRKCAAKLLNRQNPAWSLDLLRHPVVLGALPETQCTNALYLALRDGRMRIPREKSRTIINILGINRALECRCLPNYKQLMKEYL